MAEFVASSVSVVIATSLGNIRLTTRPEAAPMTTQHFLNLVNAKLYDGACFYRSDFVIQMGLTAASDGSSIHNSFPDLERNETHDHVALSNTRGTMSVAHFDVPDNGNSEIFINLDANVHLDQAYGGYSVFAEIQASDESSFSTVAKIATYIAENQGGIIPVESVRVVE